VRKSEYDYARARLCVCSILCTYLSVVSIPIPILHNIVYYVRYNIIIIWFARRLGPAVTCSTHHNIIARKATGLHRVQLLPVQRLVWDIVIGINRAVSKVSCCSDRRQLEHAYMYYIGTTGAYGLITQSELIIYTSS